MTLLVLLAATFALGINLLPAPSISSLHAQTSGSKHYLKRAQGAVIDDRELEAFARAYIQFHKIREEYEPKLSSAVSAEEKGQVQQEAVAKLGAALQQEGLSVQRYAALYQAISADQQLRDKTFKLIEEEQAK